MKSLADFKRLAVEGALFERAYGDNLNAVGKAIPPAIRKVIHRQSNAVGFVEAHQEDRAGMSWFYFPKTRRLRFENGVMTVLYDDGTVCLTLTHVRAP